MDNNHMHIIITDTKEQDEQTNREMEIGAYLFLAVSVSMVIGFIIAGYIMQ